ncbi:MAG TPA: 8-amino-7-oxononanoate synthase [Pirellulales bacterium]|jgi:8-amino-7-oxononanoate synthase|nr:8-amino-7-oxononanoate synthase [Pirellulales bacterium]
MTGELLLKTRSETAASLHWIDAELDALEHAGLLRHRQLREGPQGAIVDRDGRQLINFGSNDYLGLAADPALAAAAMRQAQLDGWGAGASPLITGHSTAQRQLESRLAGLMQSQAALVFSSGYAANIGTIAALAAAGDAIYSDQKNHASMIDGCRLCRADVHIYRHRDLGGLAQLLERGGDYRRRLIVTESVFSMDGDCAPLAQLVELARRHHAMLLVDEAHAIGVLGSRGAGLANALGVENEIDVRVGTLSKALASAGGFVCGSKPLIEWLINRARSYVFSTALPSPMCAAANAALEILARADARREHLRQMATELRDRLEQQGWNVGGSETHIIPLRIGPSEQACALSSALLEAGLLVSAIRPPTVPAGEALLRIGVTSAHTPEMIEHLAGALAALRASAAETRVNARATGSRPCATEPA